MDKYYRECYEKGTEYQDYIMEKLHDMGITIMSYSSKKYQVLNGENKAGIEIKFDDRMKETGNVYFEIAEKSNPANENYAASGIFRNDNTWLYVIGDYDVFYICCKAHLRQIYEREIKKKQLARFVETPTSKGMLLPQKYVEEKLSARTIK